MAALRRIQSGGGAPPSIALSARQGTVFIAIGAVGLTLGGVAWHTRRLKRPALELQTAAGGGEGSSNKTSPRKRRSGKRHSRTGQQPRENDSDGSDRGEGSCAAADGAAEGKVDKRREEAYPVLPQAAGGLDDDGDDSEDDDKVEEEEEDRIVSERAGNGGDAEGTSVTAAGTVSSFSSSQQQQQQQAFDGEADGGEWIAVERKPRRSRRPVAPPAPAAPSGAVAAAAASSLQQVAPAVVDAAQGSPAGTPEQVSVAPASAAPDAASSASTTTLTEPPAQAAPRAARQRAGVGGGGGGGRGAKST